MSADLVYFEDLFNAVVVRAAEDYSKALCDLRWARGAYDIKRFTDEVADLERFFTGEGIMAFTKLNGTALMEQLKKRAEECNYSWELIKKSRGFA